MSAPAFAEFWFAEEVINDGLESGGRGVGEEGLHFPGRGWKAGEIVVDATEEGLF